ncbi:MAG: hypothetical protein QOE07_1301, partial [Acidimicrobiaceae bacterium]|nr:hypothetical protein [Acidimicrobiaceae bacterium]
ACVRRGNPGESGPARSPSRSGADTCIPRSPGARHRHEDRSTRPPRSTGPPGYTSRLRTTREVGSTDRRPGRLRTPRTPRPARRIRRTRRTRRTRPHALAAPGSDWCNRPGRSTRRHCSDTRSRGSRETQPAQPRSTPTPPTPPTRPIHRHRNLHPLTHLAHRRMIDQHGGTRRASHHQALIRVRPLSGAEGRQSRLRRALHRRHRGGSALQISVEERRRHRLHHLEVRRVRRVRLEMLGVDQRQQVLR